MILCDDKTSDVSTRSPITMDSALLVIIAITAVSILLVTTPWALPSGSCSDRLITIGMTIGACVIGAGVLSYGQRVPHYLTLGTTTIIAAVSTVAIVTNVNTIGRAHSAPAASAAGPVNPVPQDSVGKTTWNTTTSTSSQPSPSPRSFTASSPHRTVVSPSVSTPAASGDGGMRTTATTTANPYTSSHTSLIIDDALTPGSLPWNSPAAMAGQCRGDEEGLHVVSQAERSTQVCLSPIRIDDATVEIAFSVTSGQAAGLAFRWDEHGHGYSAMVDSRGDVSLHIVNGDTVESTLSTAAVAPVSPHTWHTIAVALAGNVIHVFLDGKNILFANDTDSPPGLVGTQISHGHVSDNGLPPGEATFRHIRVWK